MANDVAELALAEQPAPASRGGRLVRQLRQSASTAIDEYRRGMAAARRYDELKCASARAPADVPRRVFQEFYAFSSGALSARRSDPCGSAPD